MLTLIRENWFSSRRIFAVFVIVLFASGAVSTLEGGDVSAIAKNSGTLPDASMGILTLTVKNPPVTELRDTLKHMNDSWQRLIQTKRFKSGVAGFLRTTEVTRGNDGKMMAHPHFHALLLVKPSYFARDISSNLIGSKCGRKPCEQTICRRST